MHEQEMLLLAHNIQIGTLVTHCRFSVIFTFVTRCVIVLGQMVKIQAHSLFEVRYTAVTVVIVSSIIHILHIYSDIYIYIPMPSVNKENLCFENQFTHSRYLQWFGFFLFVCL